MGVSKEKRIVEKWFAKTQNTIAIVISHQEVL